MKIKLVITDIDGVWTDGGMYYDENGNELKKFNTSDSAGVLFLHLLNIPVAIITGESTMIIENRGKKLKVEYILTGVRNKLDESKKLCKQLNIELENTAFIGDDINDIVLLKEVGVSAVPANSPDYVAKWAKWKMNKKGGEGVFREFVEKILKENDLLDKALTLYEKK